ncbi:hypothetical protein LOTGIDRAFT_171216 [Lottia gigantea]|uniref:Formin GTPase-binding domain-containing protein n=1 Tax=Lottia gigantea TaxID=225164 RepID=V4AHY7_LOTGI|nr:hypothetical protein LOTGIDRAFT_171216 [Lottia gigantea]ESP03684.1 hypothetical protein LOTGIDRAFT_171216 [Lottia gigantea]
MPKESKTTRFGKKKQNRAKRAKSDGFTLGVDIALLEEKSTETVHFLQWIRNPTIQSLAKLRKCIKFNERSWMEDFLTFDGLGLLFQCLNNLAKCENHHLGDMVLKMQCASCIREVVNSQSGFDCLLSMKDKAENLFGKRIAFELNSYI